LSEFTSFNACRFCALPEPWRIVMRTSNFIVLMGLGPIAVGYCLIITKKHYACYAEVPRKYLYEFLDVLETVQVSQQKIFGASLFFEHGRNGACLAHGDEDLCYHAHMHLLPTNINLADAVRTDYPTENLPSWEDLSCIYAKLPGSYLLIQDGSKLEYVANPPALPGRYLRTKAAEQVLGDPTLADWQAFPSYEMIREGKKAIEAELLLRWQSKQTRGRLRRSPASIPSKVRAASPSKHSLPGLCQALDGRTGRIRDVTDHRLIDLGERGILTSIVFPRIARSSGGAAGLGDDSAVVEIPVTPEGKTLLATIDPCPLPVVFDLFETDYWHFGWMTVLVNLSDLAAMGADPAGILISTVMPNDMSTHDYSRFWDGVIDASDSWNCKVLGGNIKEGKKFAAEGAAFGWCAEKSLMRRVGSSAGDLVYVVGNMGLFWSAVLRDLRAPDIALSDIEHEQARRALTRPVARVYEGKALAASRLVTACMDASDGVLGALIELGQVNQLDVHLAEVEPSALVKKVASRLDLAQLKLMLSWGDRQLVATIRQESQYAFEGLVRSLDAPVTLIGSMAPGSGRVYSQMSDTSRQLYNLSSERFSEKSYFSTGTASYIDWFINAPLFID